MSAQFFGKYRGLVVNNLDPMLMGRLTGRCASGNPADLRTVRYSCDPAESRSIKPNQTG